MTPPLIIIVTYNSRDDITECIGSVATQSIECMVAVVDNASTDSTLETLAGLRNRYPFVEIIASDTNLGFAKACNLAIRRHRKPEQPVLLLNPDCILSDGSVARLLELLQLPNVGLATLRLETSDGEPDAACARRAPDLAGAALHALRWRRGRRTAGYNIKPAEGGQILDLEATVGALMLIAGRCLDDVGLLDERFWMYGEDLDLCLRIRQAGYRIVQGGHPVVIHRKGRSSGTFRSPKVNYEFHRSLWLYYKKHLAPVQPVPVQFAVATAIILRAGLSMIRSAVHVSGSSRRVGL